MYGGKNVVVERQGFFSRLMSSIGGVFVGVLLAALAFPVLFFNEGRAVREAKGLEEGAAAVISADPAAVSAQLDGKLVHLTGEAVTEQTLTDPQFPVSAKALALKRVVEMYQWEEQTEKRRRERVGGGEETVTTYRYNPTWSTRAIDSSRFNDPGPHRNPPMPFSGSELRADRITVGAYTLSDELKGQIRGYEALRVDITEDDREAWSGLHPKPVSMDQGRVYYGASAATPEVGDVRVRFEALNPQTISVVGAQRGELLDTYKTTVGTSIALVATGRQSAEQMFDSAQAANTAFTWILRGVGWFMMFAGFSLVLTPVAVLASIIPPLAILARAGRAVLAGAGATGLSLLTIAVGWIFYRPLLGLLLFAAGLSVIIGGVVLVRKRVAASPPASPAT